MISPAHTSKILLILALACLAWIGAISLAVVYFMGVAILTGCIIGGLLLIAASLWIAMMFREVRNATELPPEVPAGKRDAKIIEPAPARQRTGIPDSPLFASRSMATPESHKNGPRKRRSRGAPTEIFSPDV